MRLKKKYFNEEKVDEDEVNIYSKEARETMLDDDELSPMEEAFMNGYDTA